MVVGKDEASPPEDVRRSLREESRPVAGGSVLKRRILFAARTASILLVFFGLATLSGSVRGFTLWGTWFPGGRSISNSASILIALSGLSLWYWTRRPLTKHCRKAARFFGVLVFAGSLFVLLGEIVHVNSNLELFLRSSQGDIALSTCVALMLQGLALIVLDSIYDRKYRPSEMLSLAAGLVAFISLLSYTYGFPRHETRLSEGEMSLPAAILTLILTFGIVAAKPVGLIGSLLANSGVAGLVVRRTGLVLTLTPAFIGWLRMIGEWNRWFSLELSTALSGAAYVLIFGAMVTNLGWVLLRTEKRRRRAEQLLLAREYDARTAFDYAPSGICQIDRQGNWIRFNNFLCTMYGYSREEFARLTFRDILVPEEIPEVERQLEKLVRREIDQFTMESRYRKKDGSLIWCAVNTSIPADLPSWRGYAIAVVEDVTERKLAQEEVARQKAAAEAANAAKDRLISIISHELRTPLTPVLAAISAISQDTLSPEQRGVIEIMRRNLQHEVCLIDDLLDLTRVTHGKLRLNRVPIDVHKLIKDLLEGVRSTFAEKGLKLRVSLNAERHTVLADPARLRQILLNLLDNARKFTPSGGQIRICTDQHENRIVIRVIDTGIGIEPKMIHRIFEAFEQGERSTQRRFGGLGLGLSISKGLAEAHGGSLEVESAGLGRGSTFTITLDLVDLPVHEPAAPPVSIGRIVTVLLVEDHEDTRVILQRLLERQGHRVIPACTVKEALEAVQRDPPDVIVSDIGLPDQSGLMIPGAVEEIRGRPVPGIALSGFGSEEDVSVSMDAGFYRHLVKPVEIQKLSEAIQDCIEAPA